MQEFIHFAVAKIIDPEVKDLAFSRYDLAETPIQDVLEDALTLPFMVPRKIILADGAHFLTTAKDSGKIDHDLDKLLAYLQSPAESTVLMLSVEAEKLDERKKLVKQLKEKHLVLPFLAMLPEELTQWVQRQAERNGCRMTDDAAERLILNAGTNVQHLAGEIEKLSLYAGSGGTIEREAVDELVVVSLEQTIFVLVDEIVRVRLDKALNILEEMLKQREEPVRIVWFISRQFRMILQVKELLGQGFSRQQAAGRLGLHPYAVKVAEDQGRAYTERQLLRILDRLATLDYEMKTGRTDKVLGLEMFLLKLAG